MGEMLSIGKMRDEKFCFPCVPSPLLIPFAFVDDFELEMGSGGG